MSLHGKKHYKRYKYAEDCKVPKSTLHRWERERKGAVDAETGIVGTPRPEDVQQAGPSTRSDPIPAYSSSTSSSEEEDNTTGLVNNSSSSSSSSSSSESDDYDSRNLRDPALIFKLNEKLYADCDATVGSAVWQTLNFVFKHSLTKECMSDLLPLMCSFLPKPNNFPRSKHRIMKILNMLSPSLLEVKWHDFCQSCSHYIGVENVQECPLCHGVNIGKFVEYPIEKLLRDLLENNDLYLVLEERDRAVQPSVIRDITSSEEYLKLKSGALKGDYDMCLMWNTDGVPVFHSSDAQLWPIQVSIAEVPPALRSTKYLLVCGLWFGESKPSMNAYLRPFVQSLQELGTEGIAWVHPITKNKITSKVIAPIICVDAPARAATQNISYFNGEFGCSLCEHEGQRVATGRGSCRVYPVTPTEPPLRKGSVMVTQAVQAVEEERIVRGVKGPTIISLLPHIDIAEAFVPDYLHCVLLGVTKQFLGLWLESKHPASDWYLRSGVKQMDTKLLSIMPPDVITRTPRSLTKRKFWKGSEYRSWLLYYSVPVLFGILPDKFFQHWLLLVAGCFILLKDSITLVEINLAEVLLVQFVREIPALYGMQECSYNVHQLTHLALSVRRWGPLWATSAFGFENTNGILLNLIHGTQQIAKQLSNTLGMINGLRLLAQFIETEQISKKEGSFSIGCHIVYEIPQLDRNAIHILLGINDNVFLGKVYNRLSINGEIYKSIAYSKKEKKRNSYTVCYRCPASEDLGHGSIKYFVEVEGNIVCLIKVLRVHSRNMFTHRGTSMTVTHILPIIDCPVVIAVLPISILYKVIRLDNYISIRPNIVEVNL